MPGTFQLIAKLSLHPVTAAIWLHEGDGEPYYSISIERRFKDTSGAWRSDATFRGCDLPLVAKIAAMAHDEISKIEADASHIETTDEAAA